MSAVKFGAQYVLQVRVTISYMEYDEKVWKIRGWLCQLQNHILANDGSALPYSINTLFRIIQFALRPCFFGWLKQFNHSHLPSTNFNPFYQQQNSTATILNPLQPTSTNFIHLPPLIYHWKKQTQYTSQHLLLPKNLKNRVEITFAFGRFNYI